MTKTKKTILSAMLCFAMVLCLSVGVVLSMPITAFATTYTYTSYENWQIKYGNDWIWSDNMNKVEDGLYKIEIFWEGSGFNVKSDENPIKKDWYDTTDSDVTIAEEVIAPINVDVYLRVIDDETLKIGIGEAPAAPVTAVELTAGELTREDLDTLPADLVTLKSITGCAEDEVEFLTAVYYFYDENKAFVSAGQKSGTEIYWVDSEFEPLSGTPDFDKIKYVMACVYGTRDLEIDDFASNVTVKVNGKDLAMIPASSECAEGYYCSGDMLDIYIVYELSAHTHAGVKQNGQPATETAAGYKDYYKCDCGLYFEEEVCTTLIGDDTALTAWKAEGGNGYIDPISIKQNGLSGGAIAGIVIGIIFGLLIIAFAVLYILWKRKNLNVPFLSKVLTPAFRFINKLLFKTKLNDVEAKDAEDRGMDEETYLKALKDKSLMESDK